MYQTMADALADADRDDTIGASVILGVEGAFCAGNDLKDFLAFATKGEFGTEVINFLMQLGAPHKALTCRGERFGHWRWRHHAYAL